MRFRTHIINIPLLHRMFLLAPLHSAADGSSVSLQAYASVADISRHHTLSRCASSTLRDPLERRQSALHRPWE